MTSKNHSQKWLICELKADFDPGLCLYFGGGSDYDFFMVSWYSAIVIFLMTLTIDFHIQTCNPYQLIYKPFTC